MGSPHLTTLWDGDPAHRSGRELAAAAGRHVPSHAGASGEESCDSSGDPIPATELKHSHRSPAASSRHFRPQSPAAFNLPPTPTPSPQPVGPVGSPSLELPLNPRITGRCSRRGEGAVPGSGILQLSLGSKLHPDAIPGPTTPFHSCWAPGSGPAVPAVADGFRLLPHGSALTHIPGPGKCAKVPRCVRGARNHPGRCSARRARGRRRKGTGRRRGEPACLQPTLPVTHPPSL